MGYNLIYNPHDFRSSFSEFASKYGKDERFKGIEKMREREAIFSDFCSDLRRKEKEEKSNQKEKVSIHGGKVIMRIKIYTFIKEIEIEI